MQGSEFSEWNFKQWSLSGGGGGECVSVHITSRWAVWWGRQENQGQDGHLGGSGSSSNQDDDNVSAPSGNIWKSLLSLGFLLMSACQQHDHVCPSLNFVRLLVLLIHRDEHASAKYSIIYCIPSSCSASLSIFLLCCFFSLSLTHPPPGILCIIMKFPPPPLSPLHPLWVS